MDYEKKYKEALEKVRQLCAYPTSKPFISDLQDLFPELAESEEEMIRKRIIHALHGDVLEMSEIKEAIDWLEKQGNANKEYWRGYREGKQEILDKYAELKKQGEQNLANSAKTCKDEQKPTEWSEEDERISIETI